MSYAPILACPRCGSYFPWGQLSCPYCGAFVYSHRLRELAAEATRLEVIDPAAAAVVWRQALDLLPPDSRQAHQVRQRLRALGGGVDPVLDLEAAPPARRDTWGTAVLKTGGSMLFSILVYAALFSTQFGPWGGLQFSAGFVTLILVHELGHVAAMRYYGLSASPPIFIPFVGALINLRDQPRDALEESVVGIGGPAFGTVGALVCYGFALHTGNPLLLLLSLFGVFLNLFNMIPVPPLDGGRITAAVSPWMWLPGVAGLVALIAGQWYYHRQPSYMAMLVLFFAWPRISQTLRARGRLGKYYDVGRRAQWAMGVAYFGLAAVLAVLFYVVKEQLGPWSPI